MILKILEHPDTFLRQESQPIEEVKPDTPSLVLFPSNYAYSHTALPVDSGTKYALVTWLGHGIDFDGMPPMYLPNGENKYAETRFQGDF